MAKVEKKTGAGKPAPFFFALFLRLRPRGEPAEVVESGVEGEAEGHEEGGRPQDLEDRHPEGQEHHVDGHDLRHRLGLPRPRGRHDDPPPQRLGAEPGHRELAADDHGHDPGGRHLQFDQGQESGGEEKLVGQRIEHGPELRLLVALPGQPAVEVVGDHRDGEDHESQEPAPLRPGQQQHDQPRDQEDPKGGQGIRKVHVPVPRAAPRVVQGGPGS